MRKLTEEEEHTSKYGLHVHPSYVDDMEEQFPEFYFLLTRYECDDIENLLGSMRSELQQFRDLLYRRASPHFLERGATAEIYQLMFFLAAQHFARLLVQKNHEITEGNGDAMALDLLKELVVLEDDGTVVPFASSAESVFTVTTQGRIGAVSVRELSLVQ